MSALSSDYDYGVRDDDPGSDYRQGPAWKKRKTTQTKKRPKKRAKAAPKLATVARIVSPATTTNPDAESEQAKERLRKVDPGGLDCVKKALALVSHPGTGEAEAKLALRMASEYMQIHSISQAYVIAAESDEQKFKRAGQSVVAITSNNGLNVFNASWVSNVACAIKILFPCTTYSTTFNDDDGRCYSITHTFYGLAEQSAVAAQAFEMVYNLILTWAALNKAAKGKDGKRLYCSGVADGLYRLAKSEQKVEEQRAIEAEKQRLTAANSAEHEERRQELARLQDISSEQRRTPKVVEVPDEADPDPRVPSPGSRGEQNGASEIDSDEDVASEEDSADDDGGTAVPFGAAGADFNDDDDIDDLLDLDAEVPRAQVKEEEEDTATWASQGQLISFRANSMAIADDYLASLKDEDGEPVKLARGRTRRPLDLSKPQNAAAYRKGQEDSKNIDVKRRRITQNGED